MSWSPEEQHPDMQITSIAPQNVPAPRSNNCVIDFTIQGTSLPNPALVWLVWNGQPVIRGQEVEVTNQGDSSTVRCKLDLSGWTVTGDPLAFLVGVAESTNGKAAWSNQPFLLT
jgi:hypothetical protein